MTGVDAKFLRRSNPKLRLVILAFLSCLTAMGLVMFSTQDTYADSYQCRTLIYRSDTAGRSSQYVQICANVDDSGNILSKPVIAQNNDVIGISAAIRKDKLKACGSATGCVGLNVDVDWKGANFVSATNTVLNALSGKAGGSQQKSYKKKTQGVKCNQKAIDNGKCTVETVTYSYNSIYNGSFSDWESAGYPVLSSGGTSNDNNKNNKNNGSSSSGSSGSNSSTSSDTDPCYSDSSSLGWIVCPLASWLGDALGSVYETFVKPSLQVDSALLAQTQSNGGTIGTYTAWSSFRDIANIIFVILVVIVILSQLTGIGVSNYGIKKALPKIIVIAVLVNLSYILCQLAVDVSNIIGYSVENLLNNVANQVSAQAGGSATSPYKGFSDIISTVLLAAGIGIGAVSVLANGAAGIIVVLLSLLSALVSVAFFFLVLGLRKAGIVLLVALSPLAIVCYALPNTEQLGKRWFNMFKALLFVYPIAGLLIGGGYLAAEILITASSASDDLALNVIAMLLFVIPFLALPSLLKKSIAGADQIFGSIVNKGEGLTGAAQGKVQNSQMMKRNQAKVAARRQMAGTRRRVGAASLTSKALGGVAKRNIPGISRIAGAGQRGMMNAYASEMRQVAADDAEQTSSYLGTMIDPKTGAYDEDKITEERNRIFEKAQRGEKLSSAEKKTFYAIADHYAEIGDAGSLVAMGLGTDHKTENTAAAKLLSDRAKSNHKIVDVAGGKKGNKAFADAIEQHGGDLSKMNYITSYKNMTPEELANQDGEARRQALGNMDMATLQGYANDSQLMNRIGKEARTDFLNATSADTGQSVASVQAQEAADRAKEETQEAERQQQEQEAEAMARDYEHNLVANLNTMSDDDVRALYVNHQDMARYQPGTQQAIEREFNIRQNNNNNGGSNTNSTS